MQGAWLHVEDEVVFIALKEHPPHHKKGYGGEPGYPKRQGRGHDPFVEVNSGLAILHAPLRSRATLDKKAEHGRRHDEAGDPPGIGWHVRRLARLQAEGALDKEWAANSYSDGYLDVYGSQHAVIWDSTLRDRVAPLIRSLASKEPPHLEEYHGMTRRNSDGERSP